jgi:hypothetical protein
MARRLSDMEWATFLSQVNVPALGLPPWGGVVEWQGMEVLVYIGPSGEVFTTDISDNPQLLAEYQSSQYRIFDPNSQVWWYNLPQQLLTTTINDAIAAGQVVQSTITLITTTAGQAAGNIIKPIVEPLTPVLIGVGLLLALMYLPRR